MASIFQWIIALGDVQLHERDPATDFERILEFHRPFVAAIEAGDVERAISLLAKQFDFTGSMVWPIVGSGTRVLGFRHDRPAGPVTILV